jgi:hypothetical protein
MQITGSDPVLAVHDLEGSAEWFRSVLGCERTDPDPGNWVFCRAGAVTFMLGRCPDALPAAELGDHSYIAYLTVDSVDAFHARAVAVAPTFSSRRRTNRGAAARWRCDHPKDIDSCSAR